MNILFLSPENPYPPDHGHHIRSFNILKCLASSHDVYFIGFSKTKDFAAEKELHKFCKSVDIIQIPEGKWRWRFYLALFTNLFSSLPFAVKRYYKKVSRALIRRTIEEMNIDFVHVDMLHLATYYDDIKDVPNAIVDHNVESLMLRRKIRIEKNIAAKLYLYLQYSKLIRFEKKACALFDLCTVVSDYDMKVLKKMSPQATYEVIPNGVDIEYFSPGNHNSNIYSLTWVGGMKDTENRDAVHYFFNDILPLIIPHFPNVKVCIVGKSPSEILLSNAHNNHNIEIIGYVDDVRDYINRSQIFIAPLRGGSGTKLKVLNAMSMERVVVTTSIGAEGIRAENGKNIIIADTPEEFANKIVYLLQNPSAAKKIGRAAREVIEKYYDWKIIGKKMDQVYADMIMQKQHS